MQRKNFNPALILNYFSQIFSIFIKRSSSCCCVLGRIRRNLACENRTISISPISGARLKIIHEWSFNNSRSLFVAALKVFVANLIKANFSFSLFSVVGLKVDKRQQSVECAKGERKVKKTRKTQGEKATINNKRNHTRKSFPLMFVRWRKNILNSHVNSSGISFA